MIDRMLVAMGVILGLLLAGSLVANKTCKSWRIDRPLCGVLTETDLHLGPALRRW